MRYQEHATHDQSVASGRSIDNGSFDHTAPVKSVVRSDSKNGARMSEISQTARTITASGPAEPFLSEDGRERNRTPPRSNRPALSEISAMVPTNEASKVINIMLWLRTWASSCA